MSGAGPESSIARNDRNPATRMNEPRLNLVELTVSELSAALKRTIEDAFGHVRVRGELGNVKYHSSGHVYLDLKDDKACLAGVIWRTHRAAHQAQARGRARSRRHRPRHHLSRPVQIPDRDRDAGAGRARRADGAGRGAQEEARRRRPVRSGAQAAAAVPAGGDRRHHLADRRGDPRHPASARRPLSAPRAGVAGARCRAKAPPSRSRRRSTASTRSPETDGSRGPIS